MSLLALQSLQPDFIKMRWMEPYVSAGLNRKTFKTLPRGIYSGFGIEAVSGTTVTISYGEDGYGQVTGFTEGSFDPSTSGWSVAVHASLQGYATTVAILKIPGGANDFSFDLSTHRGQSVFFALDVQYQLGYGSTAQIKLVEAEDLDDDPTLINIGRVDVPLVGNIVQANVKYDDAVYPRVLPFANKLKYGFMSKFQAELLEDLVSVSGGSAFVSEYVVPVDGRPQTIPLPSGYVYTIGGNDLWVHKNGTLKTAVRDYTEVDRGDGRGEEIIYTGPLKSGDLIKFRVQAYSSILTNVLSVFDESALITNNATQLNFVGTGVTVLPDGPNRAKVVIPGGGGGGGSVTRTKLNSSGGSIPAYRAVSIQSNNTIRPFDTSVSSESFYGITLQVIPNGVSGDVQTGGLVPMAGVGIAGSIGDDVFISQDNDGSMTTDFLSALSGLVIRVGILDADGFDTTPQDILFDRGRMA